MKVLISRLEKKMSVLTLSVSFPMTLCTREAPRKKKIKSTTICVHYGLLWTRYTGVVRSLVALLLTGPRWRHLLSVLIMWMFCFLFSVGMLLLLLHLCSIRYLVCLYQCDITCIVKEFRYFPCHYHIHYCHGLSTLQHNCMVCYIFSLIHNTIHALHICNIRAHIIFVQRLVQMPLWSGPGPDTTSHILVSDSHSHRRTAKIFQYCNLKIL